MNYKHERTTAHRKLLAEQGAQGYGLYWLLREEVEAQGGAVDLAFLPVIAAESKADPINVQAVALDYGLFDVEGQTIRDRERDSMKQQAKNAASLRWNKPKPRPKKPPKEQPPTPEETPRFAAFQEWARNNTPYIADPKHLTQLTAAEFDKLLAMYGAEKISKTMEDLENRKDKRKQYVSLYRTLLNWLRHETTDTYTQRNTNRNAPMDAAKQSIVGRMQCGIDCQS